jgi:hypothetical protein
MVCVVLPLRTAHPLYRCPQKGFVFDEEQLLSWVFLWWRFPQGMSEAFKKVRMG